MTEDISGVPTNPEGENREKIKSDGVRIQIHKGMSWFEIEDKEGSGAIVKIMNAVAESCKEKENLDYILISDNYLAECIFGGQSLFEDELIVALKSVGFKDIRIKNVISADENKIAETLWAVCPGAEPHLAATDFRDRLVLYILSASKDKNLI